MIIQTNIYIKPSISSIFISMCRWFHKWATRKKWRIIKDYKGQLWIFLFILHYYSCNGLLYANKLKWGLNKLIKIFKNNLDSM